MQYIAEGLVNDNGISAIALAFFVALFGAMGTTVVAVFQIKAKASEAKRVALDTKHEAEKARINTDGIANGFASDVGRKLDRIIDETIKNSDAIRKHLEHHVEREK